MRLLVFSTETMGECDMAICEAADLVRTINEVIAHAEGVEDITGQWERAAELVAHFDEFDLYIDDHVREFIAAQAVT